MAQVDFTQQNPADSPDNFEDVLGTLPIGLHRFQLVVTDDAQNVSTPTTVDVIVQDPQRPTAILEAPARVPQGVTFTLKAVRSLPSPQGTKLVKYEWTMLL